MYDRLRNCEAGCLNHLHDTKNKNEKLISILIEKETGFEMPMGNREIRYWSSISMIGQLIRTQNPNGAKTYIGKMSKEKNLASMMLSLIHI